MKKLFLLLVALTLVGCYQETPLLGKKEYKVIDTTNVSKNGFGSTLGYDVIIEIDSSYYAGQLDSYGNLVRINPRKLKINFK
jgi:hypothetical protein